MSVTELERIRHAEERGRILAVLKEDYGRARTKVTSLAGALDLLGFPMSEESVGFSLRYLADQSFVQVWRVRDMAQFRRDRRATENPDTIVWATLTPRGLQLIDGAIAEDPGVRF